MAMDDLLTALAHPPEILAQLAELPGLYLVGGWLRDSWHGLSRTDIDLIATDLPGSVAAACDLLGARSFALNERFSTQRLVSGDFTVDISALQGEGIADDLSRRDYTVNTLAAPLERIGPQTTHAGLHSDPRAFDDIEAGVLRMVARENLAADPLRSLRGYRLAATHGYEPEADTRAAWRELASIATAAAPERIHDELLELFSAGGRLTVVLRWMAADGVLWELLPQLKDADGCAQGEGNADVLTHTFECLEQLEQLRLSLPVELSRWQQQFDTAWELPVGSAASQGTLTRLGMLLHDVAKPATREVKDDGSMSFYGHQEVGAEMADPLLSGLRFSGDEVEYVLTLIREHLRLGYYSDHELTPRLVYRYIRRLGAATPPMLLHSIADCAATRQSWAREALVRHVAAAARIMASYCAEDGVARPPLLLDGNAIMELLGIRPGRVVGELKDGLLEATAAGEVRTVAEAEAWVRGAYGALGGPGAKIEGS